MSIDNPIDSDIESSREKESDKLKEVDENKINKESRKKVFLSLPPPPSVATFSEQQI